MIRPVVLITGTQLIGITRGLHHLHSNGIIHRNLKSVSEGLNNLHHHLKTALPDFFSPTSSLIGGATPSLRILAFHYQGTTFPLMRMNQTAENLPVGPPQSSLTLRNQPTLPNLTFTRSQWSSWRFVFFASRQLECSRSCPVSCTVGISLSPVIQISLPCSWW